jgi:hypothetical protein
MQIRRSIKQILKKFKKSSLTLQLLKSLFFKDYERRKITKYLSANNWLKMNWLLLLLLLLLFLLLLLLLGLPIITTHYITTYL